MRDADVQGECVLDLLCVIKDAGGCKSDQEHMGELSVDCGYDIFLLRRKEDRDLVEG